MRAGWYVARRLPEMMVNTKIDQSSMKPIAMEAEKTARLMAMASSILRIKVRRSSRSAMAPDITPKINRGR